MVDYTASAVLTNNKPTPAGGRPIPDLHVEINVTADNIQSALSTAYNAIKKFTEGNAVTINIYYCSEIIDDS